jgi:predicted TIM-barrel fold metal-dependent hydrolase
MGGSGWGWHSDVAIHILRLFAAGLFERLPRLKIIIGHMGEMIPFMLARIEMLSPVPRPTLFGELTKAHQLKSFSW